MYGPIWNSHVQHGHWSPWQENEKKKLEAVQIKAVNWITGLRGRNYVEKCAELKLETLESRRWEQDMVQTFKIMKGHGNIRHETFFEKFADRGHARTRMAAGFEIYLCQGLEQKSEEMRSQSE
jgi:hypothetical protein